MKTFRQLFLKLLAAALVVACSSAMSFAKDDRAGYQGIPVRNGLNRGIVQQDEISSTRRYPRLARRPNESDVAQSASQKYQTGEHAGYGGIPERGSTTSQTQLQSEPTTTVSKAEKSGYRGIPQPVAKNRRERQAKNTFAGQQTSALANPK